MDPLPDADLPPDPLLASLLIEAFSAEGSPSPSIAEDGRVAGPQNAQRAAELLQKHSLLHCVRLGEDRWLWFWANLAQARSYASENGLLLDEAALR